MRLSLRKRGDPQRWGCDLFGSAGRLSFKGRAMSPPGVGIASRHENPGRGSGVESKTTPGRGLTKTNGPLLNYVWLSDIVSCRDYPRLSGPRALAEGSKSLTRSEPLPSSQPLPTSSGGTSRCSSFRISCNSSSAFGAMTYRPHSTAFDRSARPDGRTSYRQGTRWRREEQPSEN